MADILQMTISNAIIHWKSFFVFYLKFDLSLAWDSKFQM